MGLNFDNPLVKVFFQDMKKVLRGCLFRYENLLNFIYPTMKFVNYHYPTLHTYVIPRQPTNSILNQMSALNSKFCKYHSL